MPLRKKCSQGARSKKGSYAAHEKIVGEILIAINQSGLCRAWEHKTGVAWREGVPVRYGLIGSSDIIGVFRDGVMLCIEVKSGNAKTSAEQNNFREMIHRYNGRHLVARSSEQALLWVKTCVGEDK